VMPTTWRNPEHIQVHPSRINKRKMADAGATPQLLGQGVASYISDDYSIRLTKMPSSMSAEQLILEFADDPNRAVNNGHFNTINVFTRRTRGTPPAVGDIYDIDLIGPDNGCVMTVQMSDGFGVSTNPYGAYFDVQAITTPEFGTLPEFGAREFGFEYAGSAVVFYTRGVSRARDIAAGLFGKVPQQIGWISAMTGIRDRIRSAGGAADQQVQRFYNVRPPT
ncbi:MAG: hypothetical protein JOY66_09620, partial [Acetobacteraceae bacterium]|nr:hypothetical protein [Acetobacteraceae bacterium]